MMKENHGLKVEHSKRQETEMHTANVEETRVQISPLADYVARFLVRLNRWKWMVLAYILVFVLSFIAFLNLQSPIYTSTLLGHSKYVSPEVVQTLAHRLDQRIDQGDAQWVADQLNMPYEEVESISSISFRYSKGQADRDVFQIKVSKMGNSEFAVYESAFLDYLEHLDFVREIVDAKNKIYVNTLAEMRTNLTRLDSLERICNEQITGYFSHSGNTKSVQESAIMEMSQIINEQAELRTQIFETEEQLRQNRNFTMLSGFDNVSATNTAAVGSYLPKAIVAFIIGLIALIYGLEIGREVIWKLKRQP